MTRGFKGGEETYHIIDEDGRLALDAAYEDHPRDLVSFLALLVEKRKVEIEPGGDGRGTGEGLRAFSPLFGSFPPAAVARFFATSRYSPLRPSCIGRDDYCIFHIHVLSNILD